VHLDQRAHAECRHRGVEVLHGRVVEDAGDQEHGVRPGSASLHHLKRIQREVLAQDGQLHGGGDDREVVERATEVLRIRQDTEGGSASGLVTECELGRIDLRSNVACAGRPSLALRDQGHRIGAGEATSEVPRGRGIAQGKLQDLRTIPECLDLGARAADLRQDLFGVLAMGRGHRVFFNA